MKKSTKFKFMWLSLVVFLIIGNEYAFFKTNYDATTEKVTASGVIDVKYKTKHSCNSSSSGSCESYYFTINGSDHSVNAGTYNKNAVGDEVTLVLSENAVTVFQLVVGFFHWVLLLASAFVGFIYFCAFFNWSLNYSDKRTFLEHLNK